MQFNSVGSSCKSKRWRGPFQVGVLILCARAACNETKPWQGMVAKKKAEDEAEYVWLVVIKFLDDLISSDAFPRWGIDDVSRWFNFYIFARLMHHLPKRRVANLKRRSTQNFLRWMIWRTLLDCFLLSLSWWDLSFFIWICNNHPWPIPALNWVPMQTWKVRHGLKVKLAAPSKPISRWSDSSLTWKFWKTHKGSLWPRLKPLNVHV